MNLSKTSLVLLALSLGTTALRAQPSDVPSNVPTAQTTLGLGPMGSIVSSYDIQSELLRAPAETRKAILSQPDSVKQIVSNLLTRRILAKEAARDGLESDPVVAASIAIARDRVLSDARLAKLDAQNTPTAVALEAYARNMYQSNAEKYDQPEQTRARHILLANNGKESLLKAKELVKKLKAGASFDDLAKANSIDPGSAARGGDLGFFGAGQMVRPFEEAVNALKAPGDISEPVESQFGYHIIRLEERKAKGRQSFEELKPRLLEEAKTAILNESRAQKVLSISNAYLIDTKAIEAMGANSSK